MNKNVVGILGFPDRHAELVKYIARSNNCEIVAFLEIEDWKRALPGVYSPDEMLEELGQSARFRSRTDDLVSQIEEAVTAHLRRFPSLAGQHRSLAGQVSSHITSLARGLATQLASYWMLNSRMPLRLLIIDNMNGLLQRGLIVVSRDLGVPTLQIHHGAGMPFVYRTSIGDRELPDKIVCSNELMCWGLAIQGIPRERLVVTGLPFLSLPEGDDQPSSSVARERLGIDNNRKIVAFLSAWVEGQSIAHFVSIPNMIHREYCGTLDAIRTLGSDRIALFVKPHPKALSAGEDLEYYELVGREHGVDPIRVFVDFDKTILFSAADAIVSVGTSTSIFEALTFDKPVVRWSIPELQLLERYSKFGQFVAEACEGKAYVSVDTPGGCKQVLEQILFDEKERERLRKQRKQFISLWGEHNFSKEKATDRIIQVATELMNAHKRSSGRKRFLRTFWPLGSAK